MYAKILLFIIIVTFLFSQCNISSNNTEPKPTSPFLYGQNLWLTDGSEGRDGYIEESLWPKVAKSGVKLVRIGGNGYDKSLPHLDTLTKWVKSIKSIGAEPMMQVSKYKSAHEAAELVRYFNKEAKLPITYWSISNESYYKGEFSIDSISKYIKSHASAMKAVDPTIKIFVPDAAGYYPELFEKLLLNNKLSVAGRDEYGNWYIDGISFHNYPNGKEYSRSDVIFSSVSKIKGMIMMAKKDLKLANEKYNRYGNDQLLWGLTEFNITYRNPDNMSIEGISVPSFINGQFWCDIFALCMEYDAFTATPWCIQESDRNSTYFGYIGGPPDFKEHSTYYHMQLMATYMNGSFFKVKTGNPYVKAYGSLHNDSYAILLMNQDYTNNYNFSFAKNKDENTLQIIPNIDFTFTHSGYLNTNTTLLIQFDKKGKVIQKIKYDIGLASKSLPPIKF